MADIEVYSGGAMRRLMDEAIPLYRSVTGATVSLHFALTRVLRQEIEDGATFDMALMPRSELDALAGNGRIVPGSQTDVVRSLVGLMVRTGSPALDIGTVEAFKTALRQARAISFSKGPSGLYVAGLLDRLGLAEEMRGRIVFAIDRPVGEVIASGEADIGMQQIIENQPVEGVHLVGTLPGELGNFIAYSAGLAVSSAKADSVRDFVAFLASPQVARIIRTKGMEPA